MINKGSMNSILHHFHSIKIKSTHKNIQVHVQYHKSHCNDMFSGYLEGKYFGPYCPTSSNEPSSVPMYQQATILRPDLYSIFCDFKNLIKDLNNKKTRL